MEELGGYDEINIGSYAEDYDLALKVSDVIVSCAYRTSYTTIE